MDDSYQNKRFSHMGNMTMDDSYAGQKYDLLDVVNDATSCNNEILPTTPIEPSAAARLELGLSNWTDHCAFRGVDVQPACKTHPTDGRVRFYAHYKAGTREPLHIHAHANLEWVVISGKFEVEAGPICDVTGQSRKRDHLVAGSWWAVNKGQPHAVKCIESGHVFVMYDGYTARPSFSWFFLKNHPCSTIANQAESNQPLSLRIAGTPISPSSTTKSPRRRSPLDPPKLLCVPRRAADKLPQDEEEH